MAELTRKYVIIATHGPEDAERASLPFVVGNGVLAMETNCTVILQAGATLLAALGVAGYIHAPDMPPLKTLVDLFLDNGGHILACVPCLKARHIEPDHLIAGVEIITTGRLVLESLEADVVLSY